MDYPNLKPFKKGWKGGPGRPKLTETDKMIQKVEENVEKKIWDRIAPKIDLLMDQAADVAAENGRLGELSRFVKEFGPTKKAELLNEVPTIVDLLLTASITAYSELNRLKEKAQTEGLTAEESRSLSNLSDTLIKTQSAHHEITMRQMEFVAKMPTEEIKERLKKKLLDEAGSETGNK